MKKVGTAMYVHKSALNQLIEKISFEDFQRILSYSDLLKKENFDYTIIKYDKGNISFIESNDWDKENEPSVGNSWCFHMDNTRKFVKSSGKIYHCKYLFVNEDYDGFDIEKAKERAKLWNSISNIKEHKSRIGNRAYWNELLKSNGIPL